MEWLNEIAQNRELPLLSAFALGLLTAIAPCPLQCYSNKDLGLLLINKVNSHLPEV